MRKYFSYDTKLKYILLVLNRGFEIALITFICEFEDRYFQKWMNTPKGKRKSINPVRLARQQIKTWISKYNLGGEAGLMDMTGKCNTNSGRPKKRSINDLDEHDRALYQEIMEEILREKGISPSVIHDRIKKKKQEGKAPNNHKVFCEVLKINRTSIYKTYVPKHKSSKTLLERLWRPGLVDWMKREIKSSNHVVGRDKLQIQYQNEFQRQISSYVWRVHWESLDYRSIAYIRKHPDHPPKEKKFKGVYCQDLINFDFTSNIHNEKWFADISYLKLDKGWYYLHVITESFSNSIIAWSLSQDRSSSSTIELLEQAYTNTKKWSQIFHSDHGVEYANQYISNFLENNNIKQPMSPKGNSLANQPSESLFSLIKREKLYLHDLTNKSQQ